MKLGLVTALVALAGCAAPQGGDTASASAAPSAPLPTPNAATVSIQGIVQASDGTAIAGVSVCIRASLTSSADAHCTTSDSHGSWTLAGNANALVAITLIKSGFFPMLRAVGTTTTDVTIPAGDGALMTQRDAATLMGGVIDPGSGYVAFSTATPGTQPTAAATVLLDSVDNIGGNGPQPTPVYVDAHGQSVPGASSGTRGVFANLAPGYYAMTFQGASASCTNSGVLYGSPITAYTPDGQARMLLPVVAGFLTAPVAATCTAVGSGS